MLQKGVGENGDRFAEERQSNPFMHTHNMQKPQDNAADSVGLMSQVTESAAFCFIQRKDTSEEMPFLEDR